MAKIKLKNVRLSFPSLFQKTTFEGTETKYEATFLLDNELHADSIAEVKGQMKAGIKEKFKGAKVGAEKLCLKDGADSNYDGYENSWSLKAADHKRPLVIDRDKSPLVESDNRVYSGCYVNAIVELWFQDNGYGKRVNANLLAVQFMKDGEPFGEGSSSVGVDEFDAFGDDESDDSMFDDDIPF
jgi:hypothetical protein